MNDRYTPEEIEHIKANWRKEPPTECLGKCDLKEYHLELCCKGCGWCEGLPVSNND